MAYARVDPDGRQWVHTRRTLRRKRLVYVKKGVLPGRIPTQGIRIPRGYRILSVTTRGKLSWYLSTRSHLRRREVRVVAQVATCTIVMIPSDSITSSIYTHCCHSTLKVYADFCSAYLKRQIPCILQGSISNQATSCGGPDLSGCQHINRQSYETEQP